MRRGKFMNEEEFSQWIADYKGHLSEYQIYLQGKADALANWFPPRRVWMPIDSAPKDGSNILVFDGLNITTVYWKSGWDQWWLVCVGGGIEDCELYGPTHWMPLPEKPK